MEAKIISYISDRILSSAVTSDSSDELIILLSNARAILTKNQYNILSLAVYKYWSKYRRTDSIMTSLLSTKAVNHRADAEHFFKELGL